MSSFCSIMQVSLKYTICVCWLHFTVLWSLLRSIQLHLFCSRIVPGPDSQAISFLDFHVTFYQSNFLVSTSYKLGQLGSGVALYATIRLLKITISKRKISILYVIHQIMAMQQVIPKQKAIFLPQIFSRSLSWIKMREWEAYNFTKSSGFVAAKGKNFFDF